MILAVLGAWLSPAQFFSVYLATWLFFLGIALGSMALLMAYHLTGGSWGLLIRRILEAAMQTLPLMALLFLPVAWGIGYLYPWAQPELVKASQKLQYQQFWMRPTYFWIRAAIYFALWIGVAGMLSVWSKRQDETGKPRLAWKMLKFSGFGAVVYGVTLHFATVDWGMSLQPVFHSTIWGPTFAASQMLSAMSFALIILARLIDRPPIAEVASLKVRNDLGSLLLTLLILWAYMAWFQFMLVWIANLPVDVVWYLPRASVGWKTVMVLIFALNFVIPFFLLLLRPVKRNSAAVARIACLILLMQIVFTDYQIIPGLSAEGVIGFGMAVLLPIGMGGLWLAEFLRRLHRQPLLAVHDYNCEAALHLRQSRRGRSRPRGGDCVWIRKKRPTPACNTSARTSGCAGCCYCCWAACVSSRSFISRFGGCTGSVKASRKRRSRPTRRRRSLRRNCRRSRDWKQLIVLRASKVRM